MVIEPETLEGTKLLSLKFSPCLTPGGFQLLVMGIHLPTEEREFDHSDCQSIRFSSFFFEFISRARFVHRVISQGYQQGLNTSSLGLYLNQNILRSQASGLA